MDKEFKKWMKWYGKKHGEYTVSLLSVQIFIMYIFETKFKYYTFSCNLNQL